MSFNYERVLMSDVTMSVGVFLAVAVGIVAFIAYSIYGGAKGSLSDAKVGEVYNFVYEQPAKGDPERYLAKVLDVHTLDSNSIRRLNFHSAYRRHDPQFHRTNHLVTCRMPNGEVRNFYAERTRNCRKPLLAGALFGTGLASFF